MDSRRAASLLDLDVLGALGDPTRRRLYEFVAQTGVAVGRDEAAAAVGVNRALAAYHLDKLAEHGLLEVSYARPDGRGGPGAGRPAKLYRRPEREFAVSAPARDYPLLAEVLLRAAEEAGEATVIERAAHKVGEQIGRAARPSSPREALRARGYEPFEADDRTIRFRNCPFHSAAEEHRGLVCSLNLTLVQGLLRGLGTRDVTAVLEPGQAACCVAVRARR
jgi:predicted ArsR family transcriptional regulator